MACELYSCLLPQCEALRICCSGFPIARIVIVNIKCLFAFLVPKNLESTLLKLWELILPSFHFSGLHDGLILRTSLQRKNFTAICCAIHRNELYTGLLNFGYLPVARN